MADIFISYKREEQPVARKLAVALERRGWNVWWDPKLRAGEHFDDVIEAALENARCVLVLWSKGSVKSRFVKDEATYALNEAKLVPVRIQDVKPPFRFANLQTADLFPWDGSDTSTSFLGLVDDLEQILGPAIRHHESREAMDQKLEPTTDAGTHKTQAKDQHTAQAEASRNDVKLEPQRDPEKKAQQWREVVESSPPAKWGAQRLSAALSLQLRARRSGSPPKNIGIGLGFVATAIVLALAFTYADEVVLGTSVGAWPVLIGTAVLSVIAAVITRHPLLAPLTCLLATSAALVLAGFVRSWSYAQFELGIPLAALFSIPSAIVAILLRRAAQSES